MYKQHRAEPPAPILASFLKSSHKADQLYLNTWLNRIAMNANSAAA